MALTAKQAAFVEHYLATGNGSEAARRAGYAGKTERVQWELRRQPAVAAAIAERLRALSLSAEETLSHLSEIGRGEYADYLEVDPSGRVVSLDVRRMVEDGKGRLLRSITPTRYGLKFEFHDRLAALGMIARFHGLLKDQVHLDLRTKSDDELIELAAGGAGGGDP